VRRSKLAHALDARSGRYLQQLPVAPLLLRLNENNPVIVVLIPRPSSPLTRRRSAQKRSRVRPKCRRKRRLSSCVCEGRMSSCDLIEVRGTRTRHSSIYASTSRGLRQRSATYMSNTPHWSTSGVCTQCTIWTLLEELGAQPPATRPISSLQPCEIITDVYAVRNRMAEELSAITPEFFEEIEDLKFNYARAQSELQAMRRGQ
jgi:hypothetical protein